MKSKVWTGYSNISLLFLNLGYNYFERPSNYPTLFSLIPIQGNFCKESFSCVIWGFYVICLHAKYGKNSNDKKNISSYHPLIIVEEGNDDEERMASLRLLHFPTIWRDFVSASLPFYFINWLEVLYSTVDFPFDFFQKF